ncbi:hypothetical protein CALVIDRAFT_599407 [Calocera viscosa TUFC12733]|uniref:BTB domain-containing protein n=1 Tax=Calocera viscosa (strain TUFC12733) TaxID=1330018 RepID=A0A167L2V6_CALVF|nr:hypothetical protein CALVIDRAFT_599407 [Calocera viscosa TUFC12733]
MHTSPAWNGVAEILPSEPAELPLSRVSTPDESEVPLPVRLPVPDAFQDPSADVLLKSSDNAFFRVHKILLVIGSTYFKELFLHQTSASKVDSTATPIELSEPASIVEALLFRLYPVVKPDISNVDELILVAVAANKYGMDSVLADVQAHLLTPSILDSRPLAVYNVACRLALAETKRWAAHRVVELYEPLDRSIRPDTVGLSAPDFIELCDLRKERVAHCLKLIDLHLPTTCHHGWELEYGPWYQTLRTTLSRKPSAAVLASIPDMSDAFTVHSPYCNEPECRSSAYSLLSLKEALADASGFLGDEPTGDS